MSITSQELQSFVETTLLSGQSITTEENLLLSGLVDSLGVMTLVAHLEGVTGRSIPAEDVVLENFASIEAIMAYVSTKQ